MNNFSVGSVFDNGGYTLDRYTISLIDYDGAAFLVTSSLNPSHPQGVWDVHEGTYTLPEDVEENDNHIGKEISWLDLPIEVREAVERYFSEPTTEIDKVYYELEKQGLQLASGLLLEDDGRDCVILCNDDAETSDDYFMHETNTAGAMLDFLYREKMIEIDYDNPVNKGGK